MKLRLAPLANHWWGIVLYVTPRGLTTGAMPYRGRALQIDFDFCAHQLVLHRATRARSASSSGTCDRGFLRVGDARAARARFDVRIWTMPVEIEGAIPFEGSRHASYDAAAAKPSGASSCRRTACSTFSARASSAR